MISTATTDDVGRFSAWAPSGAVAIVGTAVGYQDATVQSFAPASDIVLTMFVGFRAGGEVLFERTRLPAANVRVTATRNSAGIANAQDKSTVTDSKGRFVFDGLPLWRVVFGVNASHLSGRTAVNIAATPLAADVKILVEEARTVSGRFVIDATNAPCSKDTLELIPKDLIDSSGRIDIDVILNIKSEDLHKPLAIGAALTQSGAVELPAVTPGRYTVSANCDDYEWVSGPRELDIRAEDRLTQEWRFQPSLSLAVHVDANPIGGGNYSVKPLPRGQYRVFAYDNKNPQLPVPGPSGDTVLIDNSKPVKLDLLYEPPQAVITGVVIDFNGEPIEAAVQAVSTTLDASDEQYAGIQRARHGEQRTEQFRDGGAFKFDKINSGTLELFAVSADPRLRGSTTVTLVGGEVRSGVRIVLSETQPED